MKIVILGAGAAGEQQRHHAEDGPRRLGSGGAQLRKAILDGADNIEGGCISELEYLNDHGVLAVEARNVCLHGLAVADACYV